MVMQILKNEKVIETFLVGHGQKRVWPIWSLDYKIYCILRKNRWNELIFFACWFNFTQKWVWSWSKVGIAILVMGL